MKVVHICCNVNGGAGIAAARISEAMNRSGIESCVVVSRPDGNNRYCYSIIVRILNFLHRNFLQKFIIKKDYSFHVLLGNSQIGKCKAVREADVVYLHWINEFLGFNDVEYLLKAKKKVVWVMHDMWPITGGCHYSHGCKKYTNNCADCPQLNSNKWIASWQFKKKIAYWNGRDNLYLSAPSSWLTECIKESSLFNGMKICQIPNVLNTEVFSPRPKDECRKRLGLDSKYKYVLFSALRLEDLCKGSAYMLDTLKLLNEKDYHFIVMGETDSNAYPKGVKDRLHLMGKVTNIDKIVDIYNAADVFAITSVAENFPNVVIEAMSCGVPVVGFATGGICDQIEHQKNGFLVTEKTAIQTAEGIRWVLTNLSYSELSKSARKYVVDKCSYKEILKIHNVVLG